MKSPSPNSPTHPLHVICALLLVFFVLGQLIALGQAPPSPSSKVEPSTNSQILRLEKMQVDGGAELITVSARLVGLESEKGDSWVPMVSILRDTLGDQSVENDRLRYVWPLTYTRPNVKQRLAGAIPFFYTRVGNKHSVSDGPPPPAFDLAAPEREVWNKLFWVALQNVLIDPFGTPIKASTSTYRKNTSDYRKSHILRALAVLTLYQELKGVHPFSDSEMAEIQSRLMLTDKTFGGLVGDLNLNSYYARKTTETRDLRGHNWELLRQKAEAEGLYFQPLIMPDGSATHAILWVAKRDLIKHPASNYNGRFLNIANPWGDKRLLQWNGYVESRYLDPEGKTVSADTEGAEKVDLIPLALYGLDHPKIPILLVDFRDGYNPKKREMSRRALNDVTRNILSVSKFGNLPFLLGKTVYDFVTGRRGMDVNQPSRLETYTQLKLLLALTDSMEPRLREEVSDRLEKVSLNPFENDIDAEARIARAQYEALVAFAKDPNGLSAKLERDRRAELTPLEHGTKAQIALRVANILSFGTYVHREGRTVDMEARLDVSRRLSYHIGFLEQVAKSKSEIDIAWNLDDIRHSLDYIAEHGSNAGNGVIQATGKIFTRTRDDAVKRACLYSLFQIDNPKARIELQRISDSTDVELEFRELASNYAQKRIINANPLAATARETPAKMGQRQ